MGNKLKIGILLADLVCIAVAFLISFATGMKWIPGYFWIQFVAFLPIAVITALMWMAASFSLELDGFRGGWRIEAVISQVLLGVTVVVIGVSTWGFLTKIYFSRLMLGRFAILLAIFFIAVRAILRFSIARFPGARRRIAIVGGGHVARELGRKIQAHPELMVELVGFINPLGSEPDAPENGSRTESVTGGACLNLLQQRDINELMVISAEMTSVDARRLINNCRANGIRVSLIPEWYELYVSRTEISDLDGVPLISLQEHTPPVFQAASKRLFDLVISLLLVLPGTVIVGIGALLLRLRNHETLRSEVRCGEGGRHFKMYRLNVQRGMPSQSRLQRWLADTGVSELPQLWNVIRGDMSIVGPRPESPQRVIHYTDWERLRLNVKPGITGLAQVSGLRDEHASEEKTRFDLQYILQSSLFMDMSLVIQTGWTLVSRLRRRSRQEQPNDPAGFQKTAKQTEERPLEVSHVDRA
jgi:lipopolysaccharide/colanic/teichoic acid biosynthesis glycosyltransferase